MTKRPIDRERPATAVIYLRVSTKEQAARGGVSEGFSIPEQRIDCRRKADEMKVEVLREFVEKGESAKTADRHELQKMLAYIAEHRPGFLIVHKVDRFARNTDDAVLLNIELRKHGTQLVSVKENIDDTPAGRLLQTVMNEVAQYHVDNLAQEVMKGLRQKVAHGGTPFRAPLGYLNTPTMVNGREVRTVTVDEERAPHIRWMFEQYVTGEWSLKRLADAVNRRGLTTRPTPKRPAGAITFKMVQNILANPYYIGVVNYMGVEHDGQHEALVSKELFEQVQDVTVSRRKSAERPQKHSHYLTGTVTCDRCGARLVYNVTRGYRGVRYDYFTCLERLNDRACDLPYLPVEQVERAVEQRWASNPPAPESIEAVTAYVTLHLDSLAEAHRGELSQLERRIAKVQAERIKWAEAALDGTVPRDITATKQETLVVQLQVLEDERKDMAELVAGRTGAFERVLDFVQQGAEIYVSSDPATRRAYNQARYESIALDVRTENNHDVTVTNTESTEVFAALDTLSETTEYKPNDLLDHQTSRTAKTRTRDLWNHKNDQTPHQKTATTTKSQIEKNRTCGPS